MRLSDFTQSGLPDAPLRGQAPTPEPSKDTQLPGQMTVDDCIAETEREYVLETTPSGLEIMYQWAPKRLYKIRQTDPSMGAREPLEVPSVTTVLGVLDKSGPLTWWGQKVGVVGVLEMLDADLSLPTYMGVGIDDPAVQVVIDWMVAAKCTVNHAKDKAADRGVNVHVALETWCETGDFPVASDWPENERAYVEGLTRFLGAVNGGWGQVASEVMVGSLEYLYAGRYDLRLTLERPVEVVTKCYPKRTDKVEEVPAGSYLIDLKTRKKSQVYPTNYLQLEAYEQASVECGYPPTDHRGVLVVTPEGGYQLSLNKEWTFEDFLAVRKCYSVLNERERLANERELLAALKSDLGAVEVQ